MDELPTGDTEATPGAEVRPRARALIEAGTCELIQGNSDQAEKLWQSVKKAREERLYQYWLESVFRLAEMKAMSGQFQSCLELLGELKNTRMHLKGVLFDRMNDALDLRFMIQSHIKDSTALAIYMKACLREKQALWME